MKVLGGVVMERVYMKVLGGVVMERVYMKVLGDISSTRIKGGFIDRNSSLLVFM
jgi:hypothetical protein